MMTTKSAVFSALLMLSFILCYGQETNWVRQIKGSRESLAFKVFSDKSDFIYVAGTFTDSATFSPDIKLYSEKNTAFLAKYDLVGNLMWVKSLEGLGRSYGSSIAIDTAGFIFFLGGFEFTTSLGAIHFTTAQNYDQIFLIKLNPNGVPIWAKQSTGISKTYPNSIVINKENQIYLTGTLFDRTTFMGTTVTPTTWNTPFIARLDVNGGLRWLKVLNGNGGLKDIYAATTNSNGDVFFGGTFTDSLYLDSIELAVSSYYDTIVMYSDTLIQRVTNRDYFLGQIDSTGKIVWATQSDYPSDEYAYGLSADNKGNLYLTGDSQDSLRYPVFIARHNQYDGALRWIKFPIELGTGRAIASDETGNMYVTGTFGGTTSINGYQAISNGGGDIFIMNFDSSGNFNWITGHGSTNSDYAFSICESNGSIFVAGGFINEATFGNITVTATSSVNWDAFVAKLDRDFLLSIEEFRPEQRMVIFPNPFVDQITVKTSFLKNESQTFKIFDITGREVFSKVIDSNNNYFTIDAGNLRSGLYVLTLYGDEFSLVEKVIKQ